MRGQLEPAALTLCALALIANGAGATPFSTNVTNDVYAVAQGGAANGIPTARDDNDGNPDINDAINLLQGTTFARNKDVDPLFIEPDSIWTELNGTIVLIGLTAGNLNTVGVYTDVGVGLLQTSILGPFSGFGFIGDGTLANPFPAATTSLGSGASFGWFLDSSGNTFFSESGLNPSGLDHLMTFDLPNANGSTIFIDTGSGATSLTLNDPFLLGWEDLPFSGTTLGDDDYDDMLYLVDRVSPIPEPSGLLLFSVGMLVVGRTLRRRAA